MRFVVDAMLGNVARELRLLGYDALYVREGEDWELLRLAREGGRVLLTRDNGLFQLAKGVRALMVEEGQPRRQTAWVLCRLGLDPEREGLRPLTRCLECGTLLRETGLGEVASKIPPYVAGTQARFSVCDDCGRIYWHGTHAERMMRRASEIITAAREGGRG